jgi:uncharacterized membrane protein YphA (DoxX/SURF4 family)
MNKGSSRSRCPCEPPLDRLCSELRNLVLDVPPAKPAAMPVRRHSSWRPLVGDIVMPSSSVPNPFSDFWDFLIGNTDDHNALGSWKYLLVALFLALVVASIVIAVKNWREDPAQRTASHLGTWFVRVLVGGMWFQGMLWKLPLPVSGGLKYWTEQMGNRAAFAFHRELVAEIYLPYLQILNPVIFLAELTFAVSLILGLGVRLVSTLAIVFVLHLWLGIYRPGSPAEWPWEYIFLAIVMFMFALHAAGRSLGLDAWLRRHFASVRDGSGILGKLFNLAS